MRKLQWAEGAIDDLDGVDRAVVRRILKKVSWFAAHFDNITPEPLSGDFAGLYKLRVGDWRIVYFLDGESIVIHAVGHRSDVYK